MKKVVKVRAHENAGKKVPEHVRGGTETKKQNLGSGLFDNINSELGQIFNQVRIKIEGLKNNTPVNFRDVKCLADSENEEAKKFITKNEGTKNLGEAYCIAMSPSADIEQVMTQLNKFKAENFETLIQRDKVYSKIAEKALSRLDLTAKRFINENITDDNFVEMRNALNCLSADDVEVICRLNEKGDLDTSTEVLKCLRLVSGIENYGNVLKYINLLITMKKAS